MTYNPLIPIGTNNISVDRSAMQVNFQQANLLFDNDHFTFNDATSANRGYHRQIYFPVATVGSPSVGAFAGVFFSQDDANDTATKPQLFWKNSSNTYQITNRFRDGATNGYWMMNDASSTQPGLIFMWGYITNASTGHQEQNFNTMSNYVGAPVGFPNNVFNVQLTVEGSSATQTVVADIAGPLTKVKFSYRISNSGQNIYWFAIGN